MRRRRILTCCLVYAVVLLAVAALVYVSGGPERIRRARLQGKPMADVQRAYGKPTWKHSAREFEGICTGMEQEGISSRGYVPARGKVWIYRDKGRFREGATFVYFDKRDKVERINHAWWW